jgi:hypothetical protein
MRMADKGLTGDVRTIREIDGYATVKLVYPQNECEFSTKYLVRTMGNRRNEKETRVISHFQSVSPGKAFGDSSAADNLHIRTQ